MAPSGVSPPSVVVEMCLGLSKHRIQARLEGGLMGALPLVPSWMGTTGHGTVPATWTLMGMPSQGTPPLGCMRVCVGGGEEEASASVRGAWGGGGE